MPQITLKEISKTFKISENADKKAAILKKIFTRKTKVIKALDHISFDIDEGELIGYIGPNGAGKSTTIKIMSGILTPDKGNCEILGRIPWKDRIKHVAHIGVVFGQRSQLWWDVPVKDSFDLLKSIYGLSPEHYKKRLKQLVVTMDIGDLLKIPVRQLSLGQRMRCETVAALLHSPQILFLDEPTIGLDAVSKLALRDFLKKENIENGVTMILTTHDMDDIEALCNKVMVIGHGKLLYNGNLDVLKRKYSPLKSICAVTKEPIDKLEISGAVKVDIEDINCKIWFDPEKTPTYKIITEIYEKLHLMDITVEEQNIDQMIATMYKSLGLSKMDL